MSILYMHVVVKHCCVDWHTLTQIWSSVIHTVLWLVFVLETRFHSTLLESSVMERRPNYGTVPIPWTPQPVLILLTQQLCVEQVRTNFISISVSTSSPSPSAEAAVAPGDVRLLGDVADYRGAVEYYDEFFRWTGVCADSARAGGWLSSRAAGIVCSQLGYEGGRAFVQR